ncbi:MAG: hypothetical protein GY855_06495, partial [candidate division Zixibacteria bacterium]|nr:hypothetical protein [candidate division Zixibacteria bacterium]
IIAAFPVFYWNYLHDWASFAFQTSRRAGEMSSFRIDMFFGFLGSQLGIITPFIFPFMIYAIYLAARRGFSESDDRYKLLFSFAAPIIIIFTLASFRGWVKMNWPTPGYFTALIAMCAIFDENISPKLKWMKRFWRKYAIFAVSFAVIITSLSYIHSFFPILPMGKSDTMIGWYDLGKVAGFYSDKFLNDNPDNVIGYEYKIAAESAFYIDGHPDTKSDNYVGEHGLAFRFWSNPEKLIGQNFLFLYDTRFWYRPEDNLLKYFDYYYPENPLKIYGIGGKLFYFHIIRCYGYKGTES